MIFVERSKKLFQSLSLTYRCKFVIIREKVTWIESGKSNEEDSWEESSRFRGFVGKKGKLMLENEDGYFYNFGQSDR